MKVFLLIFFLPLFFHDVALSARGRDWAQRNALIVERNLSSEETLASRGIDERLRFVLISSDEREVRYALETRRKLLLTGRGVRTSFVYSRIEGDFELYSCAGNTSSRRKI